MDCKQALQSARALLDKVSLKGKENMSNQLAAMSLIEDVISIIERTERQEAARASAKEAEKHEDDHDQQE